MDLRRRAPGSLAEFASSASQHKLVATVFIVSLLVHILAQGDNVSVTTLLLFEGGTACSTNKALWAFCCPPSAKKEKTSPDGDWSWWLRAQGCGGFQNTISWDGSSNR